jgi:hypothetical protein
LPAAGSEAVDDSERRGGVADGERLGHGGPQFRPAQRRQRRGRSEAAPLQETNEPAEHRQQAGERAASETVAGAAREIGAEIGRAEAVDRRQARQPAEMVLEKIEKEGEIAPVGRDRVGRSAAFTC